MAEESCETCRFNTKKGKWNSECRRFPPTLYGVGSGNSTSFPRVQNEHEQWCGEWQERKPSSRN